MGVSIGFDIFAKDGASRVFDKVGRSAQSNSSRVGGFGKTFGKLGGMIGTGLVAGAGAIGALGVATGAWALKSASDIQVATSNLTTLTGSAATAKNMVAQLSAYGNATTFDTAPLAQAAQQMLTFGISTKDVLPDMKMLGDIAMGNQNKLNGLALVFAQVQGAGHLMGGDLNQMINNGFNPLQDMSKRTGKSMGELRQEMQKGQISFADVKKSMEDATKKGGQFYQGASNGSKTLAGAWGNLTGTLSSGLGMALQPVLPVITQLMGKLSDFSAVAIPALTQFAAKAGQALGPTFQRAGDAIRHAWPAIQQFATGLASFLGPILVKYGTYLKTVFTKAIDGARNAFDHIRSAIQRNKPELEELFRGIQKVARFILSVAGPVIGTGLKLAFQVLGRAISTAIDLIGGLVDAFNWIVRAGGKVVSFFKGLPGKITGAFGDATQILSSVGRDIVAGLANGIRDFAVSGLKSAVHFLVDQIPGPVRKLLGIQSPSRVMADIGVHVPEGLAAGIRKGKDKVSAAVADMVQAVKDKVAGLQDIKAQMLGTFTGDSIFGAQLPDGGGLDDLMAFAQKQRDQAVQLQADVSNVLGKGLSLSLVQQLQASGSSGASQLHLLAGASAAQIATFNSLNAQTVSANQAAGLQVGNTIRGGDVDSDIKRAQRQQQHDQRLEALLRKILHGKGNKITTADPELLNQLVALTNKVDALHKQAKEQTAATKAAPVKTGQEVRKADNRAAHRARNR